MSIDRTIPEGTVFPGQKGQRVVSHEVPPTTTHATPEPPEDDPPAYRKRLNQLTSTVQEQAVRLLELEKAVTTLKAKPEVRNFAAPGTGLVVLRPGSFIIPASLDYTVETMNGGNRVLTVLR